MMSSREKLLAAAEQCLMEKGSHAASIKTIAAMAGVNHGLIHHYFGSKEGLFIALVNGHFVDDFPDPDQFSDPDYDPFQYLINTVICNSKMIIELRALAFHMPDLNRALEMIALDRRKKIQKLFQINEDQAILLLATVSGLGFQSGLDKKLDVEGYLQMIVRLVREDRN
jgi:AcrR family transcriptional regulator